MRNPENKDQFFVRLPLQLRWNSTRCGSLLATGSDARTVDGLGSHGNELGISGSLIVVLENVSNRFMLCVAYYIIVC